jgi:hypothetical protein
LGPPTELKIFQKDLVAKALLLVPPTELDIFQQNLVAKALLLVIPTVGIVENLSTSYKSPNFGKTFCNKNIEQLAPPERLSTVSSPFLSNIINFYDMSRVRITKVVEFIYYLF